MAQSLIRVGVAAGLMLATAEILVPTLQRLRETQLTIGSSQVFDRVADGFTEAAKVTEPMVPRNHAVLYCVPQQQKIYLSNLRVDRDADGSVYVLRNVNMPDPGQSFDRNTLPVGDYRVERTGLAQREALGSDLLAACQNLKAQVSAGRPVSRIANQLGL